jgi:hypothetical protein
VRRLIKASIAAGIVAAVSIVPSANVGKPFSGPNYQASHHVTECNNADGEKIGSIDYFGPDKMWPPNHKYVNTTVTATSDSGGEVSLTSTVVNSQYDGSAEENGAGNTLDDVRIDPQDGSQVQTGQGNVSATSADEGSVTHAISLRSERSGRISEGRTYTLQETATIDGEECSANYTVTVPHDMRPSNR